MGFPVKGWRKKFDIV